MKWSCENCGKKFLSPDKNWVEIFCDTCAIGINKLELLMGKEATPEKEWVR